MIARSLFSVLPVLGAGLLVSACTMSDSYPEADYYSARTQARLYALDGKSFEVVPPLGAPAAAYWCAASEFARREMGADWSQEIYVQKGRAPSTVSGRIETVTFTLNETPRAEPFGLIRRAYGFKPGDNFSVSSAEGFCRELEPLLFF